MVTLQQATALAEPDPRIGQFISRYQVVERLNSGGMGVVYKALDPSLNRAVALKFLHPEFGADPQANMRFAQEARAASALDHPNICTIFEIGQAPDGSHFIAMAFYSGRTLETLLAEGPLSVVTAANLALQTAEALARAHDAGIVHRDVKPANVMVTERGLVKLLDFGVAKLSGSMLLEVATEAGQAGAAAGATQAGTLIGTLAYMSPQQLSGMEVDYRTDIWSLGTMLYEMLAGRRPFAAEQPLALLSAILDDAPARRTDVRADVPEALARVVDRCLQQDPEARYPHLDDLIADLRPCVPGRETLAAQLWPKGRLPGTGAPLQIASAIARSNSAEITDRTNQLVLLRKVRQFWIEGVLEQSIHRTMLLEVGKETRPDAVAHPWEQVLELPDHTSKPLPPDRRASVLFGEVGRSLLILGAPGGGKTITLLELARDLITTAEQDSLQSIPVVLNLSSWTNPRQPLIAWLADELSAKYQIPKRIGRSWLEANRLTLLLDGLDEVHSENRPACVDAINAFMAEYGPPGIAVCSRAEDYTALPNRLHLDAAIALRPLAPGQVQQHVARAGAPLAGLAAALKDNPALLALARSPLMLDVMSMAYWDVPAHTLERQSRESGPAQRELLFETYVDRMFQRRGRGGPYSKEQTLQWLSALAQSMQQHSRSVFLIEQLQPSWLTTKAQRWLYALSTRLIGGVLVGGLFGFFSGLVVTLLETFGRQPDGTLQMGPILKLFFGTGPMLDIRQAPISGIVFGIGAGLALGVIDGIRINAPPKNETFRQDRSLRRTMLHAAGVAACTAVAGGIGVSLVFGALEGLEVGLFFGILFAVIWATKDHGVDPANDIHTVEALTWSPKKARVGMLVGLMLGLVVGQTYDVLFLLVRDLPLRFDEILPVGVVWGISFSAIGAFFGGLDTDLVKGKTVPNQGIALSRRYAWQVGVIFGVVAGLCQGLMTWVFEGSLNALLIGILIAGFFGLTAGMWYGGLDVFHHYSLRVLLWALRGLPYRYARFLDHAQQLIFVQRVGGGVVFTHRLLLEHFASLPRSRAGGSWQASPSAAPRSLC